MITFNIRDKALELVEEGLVSADDMLLMALKYMSTDEVADMLAVNEINYAELEEESLSCRTCGNRCRFFYKAGT